MFLFTFIYFFLRPSSAANSPQFSSKSNNQKDGNYKTQRNEFESSDEPKNMTKSENKSKKQQQIELKRQASLAFGEENNYNNNQKNKIKKVTKVRGRPTKLNEKIDHNNYENNHENSFENRHENGSGTREHVFHDINFLRTKFQLNNNNNNSDINSESTMNYEKGRNTEKMSNSRNSNRAGNSDNMNNSNISIIDSSGNTVTNTAQINSNGTNTTRVGAGSGTGSGTGAGGAGTGFSGGRPGADPNANMDALFWALEQQELEKQKQQEKEKKNKLVKKVRGGRNNDGEENEKNEKTEKNEKSEKPEKSETGRGNSQMKKKAKMGKFTTDSPADPESKDPRSVEEEMVETVGQIPSPAGVRVPA